MNILPAIDQPFRFTKGFFVTWALLVAAALWFLGKVDMGPWYSALGFVLFVPFLLTFAVYGPVLIFKAARASGRRGRHVLRACAEVLVFGVVVFGGLLLYGQYIEHSARLLAWAFAPLVSLYLAWRLRRPETGEPGASQNVGPSPSPRGSGASEWPPPVN